MFKRAAIVLLVFASRATSIRDGNCRFSVFWRFYRPFSRILQGLLFSTRVVARTAQYYLALALASTEIALVYASRIIHLVSKVIINIRDGVRDMRQAFRYL